MQKLDFNKDGKLVAYTDNGCTDGKSATTEVRGTFEVSAGLVKYILAKEYDLPATICIEREKVGCHFYEHLYCYIGNDRQQKLLQEYEQQLSEYKQRLYDVENELTRLRKVINDFNNFHRRFYERKIKIENV